jgi:parvulin-like peptidyl-prolyl isomerase
MQYLRLPLSCVLASMASLAHAESTPAPPTAAASHALALARAGDIELTALDVRAILNGLSPAERSNALGSLPALEQTVRGEVTRRALLAEAHARNLEHQPTTAAALERVRNEALIRLWLAEQAAVPASYPSEAELKSAYEANKLALSSPAEYRLAQVFIAAADGGDTSRMSAALRKATDVATRVAAKGADFAKLARELSEHSESAALGGDMGFLAESRLLPEVAAAVRPLGVGDITGPIKTALGLHFIKLLDKHPGVVPAFAEVRERLSAALRARRAGELEQAYVASLSSKLGVTINQIELAKLQPTLR